MAVQHTENTPEVLLKTLQDMEAELKSATKKQEDAFVEMKAKFAEKPSFDELSQTVTAKFADATAKLQDLGLAVNDLKKQIENPLYGTNSQVADAERKAAIEHERILFQAKNDDPTAVFDESKCDHSKYRSIKTGTRKLIGANTLDDWQYKWANKLTEDERKALSMSQIDGSYFLPEVQTVIRDIFLEPVGLFDLYDTFNVSKMTFQYPFIKQHTALGGYICSDDCGTIQAANVNLQFRQEQVYDWRGTFCVTTRTLADSAIDLLAYMAREMALSKRMTSNQAWISGDGVKQPKGWLTNNLFPIVKSSSAGVFTAPDVRAFLYRVPPEYGPITAVMHPNTLAVLMAMTNAFGEFIFGEGMLFAEPTSYVNNVRLSRYMPEISWTVTPGTNTTAAQIAAPSGSLVCAAANWKKAYMVPTLLPMMMRQGFMIQGPWCAQYHFWAQDGGAPVCGEAGRVLQIQ